MFFSAPIFHKTAGNGLLIGVRSKDVLQQMLQNVDFKNRGLCCIVDKDGTVVVAATDETPFLKLNDIFNENTIEDIAETQRMLEDINDHRSGVAQIGEVGGEPLILGYDFLEINDWMLLTLVTADLLGESTTPYLIRYVAIIAFLLLVMVAIALSVICLLYTSIAGAGKAAHLPGMCAAIFPMPVIGIPMKTCLLYTSRCL